MAKRKKAAKRQKPVKPATLGEVIDGGVAALTQLPTLTARIAALRALTEYCGGGAVRLEPR